MCKKDSLKVIFTATLLTFVVSFLASDLLRVKNSEAAYHKHDIISPYQMLKINTNYSEAILKGVKVNYDNPFKLEFLIDSQGQNKVSNDDIARISEYFLLGLTLPESDIWVNLSPYETDKIESPSLSATSMGDELLKQDYLLKQMSASLTHPELDSGKKYWKRVIGDNKLGLNSIIKKVWVTPDQAQVYEKANVAIITKSSLKILSEKDYFAQQHELSENLSNINETNINEEFLETLSKEVNNGKYFSRLRQIYNSLMLSTWFKRKLKDSIYKHYIDNSKLSGIEQNISGYQKQLYKSYLQSYTKGVYNITSQKKYIDHSNKRRNYFSGGIADLTASSALSVVNDESILTGNISKGQLIKATVDLDAIVFDDNSTSSALIDKEFLSPESLQKRISQKYKSEKGFLKTIHDIGEQVTSNPWEELESIFIDQGILHDKLVDVESKRLFAESMEYLLHTYEPILELHPEFRIANSEDILAGNDLHEMSTTYKGIKIRAFGESHLPNVKKVLKTFDEKIIERKEVLFSEQNVVKGYGVDVKDQVVSEIFAEETSKGKSFSSLFGAGLSMISGFGFLVSLIALNHKEIVGPVINIYSGLAMIMVSLLPMLFPVLEKFKLNSKAKKLLSQSIVSELFGSGARNDIERRVDDNFLKLAYNFLDLNEEEIVYLHYNNLHPWFRVNMDKYTSGKHTAYELRDAVMAWTIIKGVDEKIAANEPIKNNLVNFRCGLNHSPKVLWLINNIDALDKLISEEEWNDYNGLTAAERELSIEKNASPDLGGIDFDMSSLVVNHDSFSQFKSFSVQELSFPVEDFKGFSVSIDSVDKQITLKLFVDFN